MGQCFFLRKFSFCFGMFSSKCSALLPGNLQKSYFIYQILPFLYRLTEFCKMYKKGQRTKVKEIIVLIKARSFLDELNLEHLTS